MGVEVGGCKFQAKKGMDDLLGGSGGQGRGGCYLAESEWVEIGRVILLGRRE